MNRGFAPVVLVVVVGLLSSTLLVSGGVYTFNKINQLEAENQRISEALLSQTGFENNVSATTSPEESADLETSKKTDDSNLPAKAVETEVIHVPQVAETVVTNSKTKSENTELEILDTDFEIVGNDIQITWETTKPSDSRLILDTKIFVSDYKNSMGHSVLIAGLPKSTVYSYEIIATNGNEEVSYFDKFNTPREFVTRFEDSTSADPDCFFVIIEDTAGKPLVGARIKITGSYSGSNTNFMSDTLENTTDKDGKVEYCDKIDKMKIIDVDTREEYYKN